MYKSFSGVSVLGDFDVINFSDVTAEIDIDNTAVFQFEFDPVTRLNTSLGYALHLTWRQVSGPASGVIEVTNYSGYGRLEIVDRHAGTYRLYVPLHHFEEGRLLVNIRINISCSELVTPTQSHTRITYPDPKERWNEIIELIEEEFRSETSSKYGSVYVGNSRYECDCNEWQIRGMSNSLQINAKRG